MKKVKADITTSIQNIDWEKKQWLQCKNDSSIIVLTIGTTSTETFSGTALPCNYYPDGLYCNIWGKNSFKILETEIPFTISNKD